jgi:hypothetical protein
VLEAIKRIFGIGTRVRPVTTENVQAAQPDPELQHRTEEAKKELSKELVKIERQSVEVRRLLAQDALELIVRPARKNQ